MAKFTTDPSERWKTVPKGEYNVMITKAEIKDPKPDPRDPNKEKHQYIEVAMQILDGEYANETVTDRLSLSPKAKPRLNGFLYAAGLAAADTKGEVEFDTDDFVNKFLTVKGDVETFQGQERFRPSSFKPHPDAAAPVAEEAAPEAGADEPPTPPPAPPAKAAAPVKPAAPAKPAPVKAAAPAARRPI
jgi:pyruvate/2-oxoglutarate dehydrogenase complex dihydrolipoamide acyltransferase (E2) component